MAKAVRLEVFGDADMTTAAVVDPEALEEARLASFEQGYKAGWDDATATQQDEQTRLRSDVSRNLQELSFTYHEARGHLLKGVWPLFEQICARVVPELAAGAIGGVVQEALQPLAEAAIEHPVILVLNPEARAEVESVLASGAAPPFRIVEEPSLAAGQLYIRWEEGEEHIDMDAAIASIRAAVHDFFHEQEALKDHG